MYLLLKNLEIQNQLYSIPCQRISNICARTDINIVLIMKLATIVLATWRWTGRYQTGELIPPPYIKATVGSSFHWQQWGKWPKIALLPYMVAFLTYTYTKQTNNKEQKQKILLSSQLLLNNDKRKFKTYLHQKTLWHIQEDLQWMLKGRLYRQRNHIWALFI